MLGTKASGVEGSTRPRFPRGRADSRGFNGRGDLDADGQADLAISSVVWDDSAVAFRMREHLKKNASTYHRRY